MQLLLETGFTFAQAIRFASLNGAEFLGKGRETGSIEAGKRADLILADGDPARRVAEIRNIDTVFKGGGGYDSGEIIAAMRETVGLH